MHMLIFSDTRVPSMNHSAEPSEGQTKGSLLYIKFDKLLLINDTISVGKIILAEQCYINLIILQVISY